ncbi:MAG: DUF169 domain-containing protein [Nitrososphaeria archaeon]
MTIMPNLSELKEKVMKTIQPKGEPVAFKLYATLDEVKKLNVPPLEKNLALCQLLKYCAIFGKTRYVTFENVDSCVVGSYVLGLGLPPEDVKERWVRGFAYDPKIFDKLVENIESIPLGKYSAAVFGTMEWFDKVGQKPDGIILLVNSTQTYLLSVGFFDATGKKIVSAFNGHAACEIVAAIEKGKSPWVTIPCGGARGIAEAQDDELWVGMKVDELETTINRLESVGLKYPPFVYEMITADLNPDHPLTGLIARKP